MTSEPKNSRDQGQPPAVSRARLTEASSTVISAICGLTVRRVASSLASSSKTMDSSRSTAARREPRSRSGSSGSGTGRRRTTAAAAAPTKKATSRLVASFRARENRPKAGPV